MSAVDEPFWVSDEGLQEAARKLCAGDPLAQWLLRISGGSGLRAARLALVIYLTFVVAAAFTISLGHHAQHPSFLGLTLSDLRALPDEVAIDLILTSIVWAFYAWQPWGIANVFAGLFRNGVVTGGAYRLPPLLDKALPARSARKMNLPIALIAPLVILPLGVTIYLSPNNPTLFGYCDVWWHVVPAYFWLVWLPLAAVIVYMVVWIILRHVAATESFNQLFRAGLLESKPYFPDRCGGFGPVGDYARNCTFGAMSIGLLGALTIAYANLVTPYLATPGHAACGQTVAHASALPTAASALLASVSALAVPVVFDLVAIPFFLIYPLWEAHVAMGRAKDHALEEVAAQIRPLLAPDDSRNLGRALTRIEQLSAKYDLIDKQYGTWPLALPPLQRIGVTLAALASLVPSLIPLLRFLLAGAS